MSPTHISSKLLIPCTLCALVFGLVISGCRSLPTQPPPSVLAPEAFSPAGIWLYEDKLVAGEAKLDENGNGRYPWKKGYFVTSELHDRDWKGTWHQPGNNREGGFELRLSADFLEAKGRWWYTRIGTNTSPTKPGGTFSLIRISY